MCYKCYENAGKPAILNDKVRKAADLIDEIYDSEDGAVGGLAHIVVDDWNVENNNIDYVIEYAKEDGINKKSDLSEETRLACLNAMEFFKELTLEERHSAMALHYGFIEEDI